MCNMVTYLATYLALGVYISISLYSIGLGNPFILQARRKPHPQPQPQPQPHKNKQPTLSHHHREFTISNTTYTYNVLLLINFPTFGVIYLITFRFFNRPRIKYKSHKPLSFLFSISIFSSFFFIFYQTFRVF